MLDELKKWMNKTYTENGATTFYSTGSDCLDLFATVGALRLASEENIITRFTKAFAEDRTTALKILFFARDIRGGLGERRVFRVILSHLAKTEAEIVKKNIPFIAEYGRYDDLLCLLSTPCDKAALEALKAQWDKDILALREENALVSLLGKWLPSVNASNAQTKRQAKRICKAFALSERAYRKTLTSLRERIKILENYLREKDYTFDYSTQPSLASLKYRKAFIRNDNERYAAFLRAVQTGTAKLNTAVLTPYDIVRATMDTNRYLGHVRVGMSKEERLALDTSWNALEDFTKDEDSLVVVDGSGSMYWSAVKSIPATVALSLGIYFAEHNKGRFKNHFITFSGSPRLIELKGADIYEKVAYCMGFREAANTNLERVFDLILQTAVINRMSQADMPKRLYVVSDMQFDRCVNDGDKTNFQNAKEKFEAAGFALPQVVFWNVCARAEQQPVEKNESGVTLVSGYTPRLFSMMLAGETDPMQMMKSVVESERYQKITA